MYLLYCFYIGEKIMVYNNMHWGPLITTNCLANHPSNCSTFKNNSQPQFTLKWQFMTPQTFIVHYFTFHFSSDNINPINDRLDLQCKYSGSVHIKIQVICKKVSYLHLVGRIFIFKNKQSKSILIFIHAVLNQITFLHY